MAADDPHLIAPISERQFELYALSLERGPNFDQSHIFSAYRVGRGSACGCILLDPERGAFTTLPCAGESIISGCASTKAARSLPLKQRSTISASACAAVIRPNRFRLARGAVHP